MAEDPHLQAELSVVGFSEYVNGFQTVTHIGLGNNATMPPMTAYYPCGLAGRPRDPDSKNGTPTAGAPSLTFWEGSRGHALPLGPDPRVVAQLPPLNKGGVQLYANRDDSKVTFLNLDGTNGDTTLYVPYAETAMAISVKVSTPGTENIQIVHGSGMVISMQAGGNNSIILSNKAGDAYIEIGDNGITLNGKINHVGNFNVGIPSPLEVVPPPVPPDAVVLGTPFTVWLAALTAAGLALSPTPLVVPPIVLGTSTKFKAA